MYGNKMSSVLNTSSNVHSMKVISFSASALRLVTINHAGIFCIYTIAVRLTGDARG